LTPAEQKKIGDHYRRAEQLEAEIATLRKEAQKELPPLEPRRRDRSGQARPR